jgi:hypothetical protein
LRYSYTENAERIITHAGANTTYFVYGLDGQVMAVYEDNLDLKQWVLERI